MKPTRFLGRRIALAAIALGLLAAPAAASAATYEVCPAGPPACDFSKLSDAVSDAAVTDGDRIELAAGTYFEPQGVNVSKALEIEGAGSGQTIIDGGAGTAPGQTGQIRVQTGTGQDVSITGLTIREPVSSGSVRIALFSKANPGQVPGPNHTFTDVAIRGVGGAAAGSEYGLWTYHSTATMVFDQGSVRGVRYNPVLIESPLGPTTVSGSEIARGTDCCGVFYMTAEVGDGADHPQVFTGNELTGGANVSFNAAFNPAAGGFESVEVSDNTLSDLAGPGVTLANNGTSAGGTSSAIRSAAIEGNVLEGTGGTSRGVTLQGRIVDPVISGNSITGLGVGVRVAAAGGDALSRPVQTVLRANRIAGNGVGLENQSLANVEATQNWWGCNDGPAAGDCDDVTGLADSSDWLTLSFDGPTALNAGDVVPYQADVLELSGGGTAGSPGDFPVTPVAFTATAGSIDSPKDLVASVASTDYTVPNWNGPVELAATLDNETQTLEAEVTGAPITPTRLTARPMVLDDEEPIVRLVPLGRVEAELVDDSTGEPIEGKEIHFYTDRGRELCSATTNDTGVAACTVDLELALNAILQFKYQAHFFGDPNTAAASAYGKLARVLRLLEL